MGDTGTSAMQGTRYNTREEIIRVLGRSMLDINRSQRQFGRRWYTWEANILKECKCDYLRPIKSLQRYRGVAIAFYPALVNVQATRNNIFVLCLSAVIFIPV
jgi:hypothetical protein